MELLRVKDAAKLLSIGVCTMKKRIASGMIKGYKTSNSPCATVFVMRDDCLALLRNARWMEGSMQAFDEHGPKGEDAEYDEIVRRVKKMQELYGSLECLRPVIQKLGIQHIYELHPSQYATFRAHLLTVARRAQGGWKRKTKPASTSGVSA